MTEATEAVEVVADVVEATGDVAADAIRSLTQVKIQYGILGAVAGAAAGSLIAWALAYRKARKEYREIAEDEISQMSEHFRAKEVAREGKPSLEELKDKVEMAGYVSPSSTVEQGGDTLAVLPEEEAASDEEAEEVVDGEVVEGAGIVKEEVLRNVFEEHRDTVVSEFDYEHELRERKGKTVYVIHKDEVGERGEEYSEGVLLYYEVDDVVCDDDDHVIDNVDVVLGDFASKFGYGSEDVDKVYIRNEDLMVDYEVTRSSTSFAEDRLGLQHSESRSRRHERFRPDDE